MNVWLSRWAINKLESDYATGIFINEAELDVSQGESWRWMRQMAPVSRFGYTRQHFMHAYERADSAGGWEETNYLENFHWDYSLMQKTGRLIAYISFFILMRIPEFYHPRNMPCEVTFQNYFSKEESSCSLWF